jgi:hypothetical protein
MIRTNVIMVILAALTAFLMFAVSYRVKALEEELVAIERARVESDRTIHVLRAEWSFLTRPDRLSELVSRHLELGAVGAGQAVAFDAVPALAALAAADAGAGSGAALP